MALRAVILVVYQVQLTLALTLTFVDAVEYLLPFIGRDNEELAIVDKSIFNSEGITVDMVWAQHLGRFVIYSGQLPRIMSV